MQNEEVMELPGKDNPVLCADGSMGMLIIYPGDDGKCGIQVNGEDDIRWIPSADLTASDAGSIRQAGAPDTPPQSADMVQMLLAMDWSIRGGVF